MVRANVLAARADVEPGAVVNICGGSSTLMSDVIDAVREAVGAPVSIEPHPEQPGDVIRTGGSNAVARAVLGWEPEISLAEGIAAQVAWHRDRQLAGTPEATSGGS